MSQRADTDLSPLSYTRPRSSAQNKPNCYHIKRVETLQETSGQQSVTPRSYLQSEIALAVNFSSDRLVQSAWKDHPVGRTICRPRRTSSCDGCQPLLKDRCNALSERPDRSNS